MTARAAIRDVCGAHRHAVRRPEHQAVDKQHKHAAIVHVTNVGGGTVENKAGIANVSRSLHNLQRVATEPDKQGVMATLDDVQQSGLRKKHGLTGDYWLPQRCPQFLHYGGGEDNDMLQFFMLCFFSHVFRF